MTRLEQLRKMINWDVLVICNGRETGLRVQINGILKENSGVFELWRSGEVVYRFIPAAVNCISITPGFRPALFTGVCEDGLKD